MAKNDHPAEDPKAGAEGAADRTQGADAAQRAREKAEEYADAARNLGREYADASREEVRRLYRKGRREAHHIAEHAEDYYDELSLMVRRHPVQAIGIAAGVGLLVGLLIARR